MSYSADTYRQALKRIEDNRRKADETAKQKTAELYAAVPSLQELDDKMSQISISAAKCAISMDSASLAKLRAEYDKAYNDKLEILHQCSLSENDLKPKYKCGNCNDTGYVDGMMCSCVRAAARKIEYSKLSKSMPLDKSTFDKFDLSYYPDEQTKLGNPRKEMQTILNDCISYANSFSLKSPNMLFMGATGLGKTHLSLAIAGKVVENGYGVVYGSAQTLLNSIEKEHFGKSDDDTLSKLCECDLLILDDLGAELNTAFNSAAVYNIINSRILTAKPMIINTNLTIKEIEKVYGERVVSRMIGNFNLYRFIGNDIRQQKAIRSSK